MIAAVVFCGLVTVAGSAPESIAVSFVSDPGDAPWILNASFTRRSTDSAELSYCYRAESWLGQSPLAEAAPANGVRVGGRRFDRVAAFRSLPPLDGWPERDALGLVWHADGGLEVRLGAQVRLETAPVEPVALGLEPLFSNGAWAWARAELVSDGRRRSGVVVVEVTTSEPARSLLRIGAIVLHHGDNRGLLVRASVSRPVWARMQPGASLAVVRRPPRLTWIDGVQHGGYLVPTAFRIEDDTSSLLLERVDPLPLDTVAEGEPASSGADSVSVVPLAGAGYAADQYIATVGFIIPPVIE